MKGIVFNLLEEVVTSEHGPSTWDALLGAARLDGAYTSLGNYPDTDLTKLVEAASASLGQPPDDIVRWFGRNAFPLLAQRFPNFIDPHTDTRAFLLTLNDIIHPEVRKLYPGADVPVFDFVTSGEHDLTIGYGSQRKLCALAEGFIEAAATRYGEHVTISQPECMRRGDTRCLLRCSFSASPPTP